MSSSSESHVPDLSLNFGESGFGTNFVNGERVTRLVMEPGVPNLHMDTGPAMRLGDVCIYAAYVADGLRIPVSFDFNGVPVIASRAQVKLPEDDLGRLRILDRFTTITGAGELSDNQKIRIGGIAAFAMDDYHAQLRARRDTGPS
jgi:hypothetical protein